MVLRTAHIRLPARSPRYGKFLPYRPEPCTLLFHPFCHEIPPGRPDQSPEAAYLEPLCRLLNLSFQVSPPHLDNHTRSDFLDWLLYHP